MTSKRLKRLGLNAGVLESLSKANVLTCKDLLNRSELELLRIIGAGAWTVRELVLTACRGVVNSPVTAYEIWVSRQETGTRGFLPTSLPGLDNVLHGGISTGTITEIAGPSGCGKTQFSLQLSVLATLPTELGGLNGAVLYIDTESTFTAERLMEIAACRFPQYFDDARLMELSQTIFVNQIQTCAHLFSRLNDLEADIIRLKVKLVVIDSIASLVRKEYDNRAGDSMADRTKLLSKQAAILKYLGETFSIPIVVTNQITTRFGRTNDKQKDYDVSLEGEGGYVTAALGNTWSHSVNTRLILQYLHGNQRQVMVAKSPIAPFTVFKYTIQSQGIVQDEDGGDHYEGTDPGIQRIRVRSAIPMDAPLS